jgi:chemotaxis-related protein WspD
MMERIAHELAGACFRRIGVAGDRSCPELERHVHCRNCPAFSDTAQRTMQLPVDAAYRASWARHLSQPEPSAEAGDASVLVFRIGGEWLALPCAMVRSVAPLAAPHRLPHRPQGALLGVVNIGGRLAPAVSLAALFDVRARGNPGVSGRHAFARLLVVDAHGVDCALPVDELHGVLRYAAASLVAPAPTIELPFPAHLAGVLPLEGRQVGILDGALVAQRIGGVLR